jgi:hypothetical protein
MMQFDDIIKQISTEFTDAWNKWDMDRIMCCLHSSIIIESPNISKIYPSNTNNMLIGKDEVRAYWEALKLHYGHLKVTQFKIEKKDCEVTTLNLVESTGVIIKETFTMNEYGKINHLIYKYIQPEERMPISDINATL